MMEKIKHIKLNKEFYKTLEGTSFDLRLWLKQKVSLFESKAVKMECFN